MFKPLATVSVFAAVALAVEIPTGISSGCTTFLQGLSSANNVQTCLAPLVSATAKYGVGATGTLSTSALTSALDALCALDGCETIIRAQLTSFYSACTPELTSGNKDVLTIYDTLYVLAPFKTAVCAKNDGGDYCVVSQPASVKSNVNLAAGSTGSSLIQKYLYTDATTAKRAETNINVNTTTFATNNLVFLFLKPDLATADLCQSCTRSVLKAYIQFESDVPYGPGLAASPLLSSQSDLLDGVTATCGNSFLSGTVAAAGGLAGGTLGDSDDNSASRAAFSTISMVALFGLGAALL